MKTAVSIPDETFQAADRLAERHGWTRSQLYARALREFLERQEDDPVTAALDALADQLPPAATSGRQLIDAGMWEW